MCVGRQVKFRVDGASTGTKEGARQFATLWVCTAPGTPASQSINLAIATAGMGRVGDALSARGDEFAALESAGRVAQDGNVGMWAHDPGQGVRRQIWQLSAEQAGALASELKDKPIQAVVESVLSGSSVRVCIPLANNGPHIMSTFHIAAVQCPRAAAPAPPAGAAAPAAPQDKAEPYGNEARAFAESRLLHRDVALHIGGADKSGAFVGRVEHPAGDIAAELLKAGLGKVVDWSASFDSPGHVGSLRAAERAAKSAKAKVWASYEPSTSKLAPAAREYMGRVVEVASGDSIVVLTNPGRAAGVAPDERRVSLSSLKAPRLGNPRREEKDAPWAWEAKEHLRRALIGREVHVAVDYTRAGAVQEDAAGRPLAGGAAAPDRVFGTVTLETKKGEAVNVAVGLLEAGYAEVVKHRAEEDRARDYDRLLEAEAAARSGKKGLHSAKGAEGAPVHRVADITGDSVKAKAQFPFLKRAGSLRAVVEHVFAGGRVKLYFPSEQVAVMFGIAAVRCPAVGKAAAGGGKGAAATPSEPMGPEALQYMRETVLQQEVEVECEEVDRNGTVLGPLYLGKGGARKNIGAELLKRGLGRAVWPVVERVRDSEELVAAEEEAKAVKKGLWAFVKEEEEADGAGAGSGAAGARGASATLGDAFASLNLDKAVVAAAPSSAAGEAPSPAIPCVLADITDGRHFTLQAEADRERIAAVNAALDALYEQHGLKHEIVPDLRKGKVVACLFDEGAEGGKRWYRGRIDGKAASGGKTTVSPAAVDETGLERWEVTYMDYGNCGVATVMSMRPLDASTAAHPPFARRGGLAYLRVPTVQAEHGAEAAAMLSDIAFGRPLLGECCPSFVCPASQPATHVPICLPGLTLPYAYTSIPFLPAPPLQPTPTVWTA